MKAGTFLVVALLGLAGCATIAGPLYWGDELDWEDFQSIRPGMSAGEIREMYGEPNEVRRDGHLVIRFSYRCWDQDGRRLRTVDLVFDKQEILVEKSLW